MLNEEIESAQRLVKTDAYQLSIGEIVNMYRDSEFFINPDFQRLFRWEIGQKAKFIESLLLGILIPSIFVFEKEDSTWELIDGLQRISTILEFMGQLTSGRVIFGPEDCEPLLGLAPLESVGIVVEPATQLLNACPRSL